MTVDLKTRLVAADYRPDDLFRTLSTLLSDDGAGQDFDRAPTVDAGHGTRETTWISEDGTEVVFLSDDALNRILRIDISAETETAAEARAARIAERVGIADFEAELSSAQGVPDERLEAVLVRLAQMAPVRQDRARMTDIVSRALASPDGNLRRAGTFAAFLIQSPALIDLVADAARTERDAELRELMSATVETAGQAQGPTLRQI